MKTKINSYKDDFTRLVDSELSEHIVQRDISHRKKHQGTAQKLSTLDYRSLPETAKILDYIGGITADYQLDVDHVDARLSGGLQKVKGQSHVEDSKEAMADVDKKINKINQELAPLVGKLDEQAKKYEPAIRKFNWFIAPMIIFISGLELLANFQIFSLLGGGLISNIATAVLTVVFVHWYGYFSPSKVKNYGKGDPRRELLIFLGFCAPLFVLFWQLSSMRIRYLIQLNPKLDGVLVASPLVFVIINMLAFIIIYWLVAYYLQPKEVVNRYKNYKRDRKAIVKLEVKKKEFQEQRNRIAPELRGKLTDRYNVLLLGKQKEREIQTRMRTCFEEFKSELFLKTNGACAKLFTGDIEKDLPQLRLNYQDVQPQIQAS
ncbi:hypothetical protein [Gilvibacter sediminis]|uniref:hypothetical protein n=1 Tax=Gilvibacter sediminis TaxID=379071 RepID=UPI002350E4D7|nr:hypothetical protein [Gilvibacter sediminis]MDC7996909.1 hypothetical protein [Gilvibacter sediminis]